MTGLVAAIVIAAIQGLFTANDVKTVLIALCDSFTVPGVIYVCAGLLIFCANGGTFDMLGYGVKAFFSVFQSAEKMKQNKESFADYRERKRSEKRPFVYLIVIGAAFLAIALVLLIVYINLR